MATLPLAKLSVADHFSRVKSASLESYRLNNLSEYIEKNVVLDGKPYSFKNYEFQRPILNDTSPISMVVKLAQIGLSTLSYAHALSCCAINKHWGYAYIFPKQGDATKACATRINPMIAESPNIARLVNFNVDSTELKQIGSSFLYFRGTMSDTAALSISLDFITVDEYDRCDQLVAAQYVSRLQGKGTKMRRLFSTPTFDNFGIMKEAKTAKRYRHVASCARCNHKWLPSYHLDVKIPGYDRPLNEINKQNIKDVRWQEAAWVCPKCGRNPNFDASRLEWVLENSGENYEANCWFISPATAHKVLAPSYLVNVSTQYGTYAEFTNQGLGEPVTESNDNILESDVTKAFVQADLSDGSLTVLGADMGLLCYVTIARRASDGTLLILHRENVPLAIFETRRRELCAQFKVVVSVHDVQPYVDVIQRITDYDPNAYGAVFTTSKHSEMYTVVQKEADKEEGKLNVRRVNVNRTAALDRVMSDLKEARIVIKKQEENFDSAYVAMLTNMKRTQIYDKSGDLLFTWQKTDGVDHAHFSLLYAYLAAELRATASTWTPAGVVPLMARFKQAVLGSSKHP